MKEIVAMRIVRTEAGKSFPFDIVYFFHKDLENTLARIFKSGIVMPITKTIKRDIMSINKTTCPETRLHTFDRNDAAELNENPLDSILHETSKDLMFVPILFTRMGRTSTELAQKQTKRVFPLYLAAKHQRTKDKNIATLFSNYAYLLFGGKKVRPVCLACPMHMLAITGQCKSKLEDCYKQITCAAPSTFALALKEYNTFAARLSEPEIKDGRVQAVPD